MSVDFDIQANELTSHTTLEAKVLTTCLIGTADTAVRVELDRFIKALHKTATEEKVSQVVVNLRGVDLMNSSCFKSFVVWLGMLDEAASDQKYRVRFLADNERHWQSRSLAVLACFAADLIDVEGA
ncbi:MAG TPA: hypothetical protein VM925_34810 [Labilithrix sp.]|nr:hypothetical protein [Labilithrix sp.]